MCPLSVVPSVFFSIASAKQTGKIHMTQGRLSGILFL